MNFLQKIKSLFKKKSKSEIALLAKYVSLEDEQNRQRVKRSSRTAIGLNPTNSDELKAISKEIKQLKELAREFNNQ